MNKILTLIFCSIITVNVFADTEKTIDSLHLILNNSTGTQRVLVLNKLAELLIDKDVEQSGHLAKVAVDVAKEENLENEKAIAYKNLAIYYDKVENSDSAVYAYLSALNYYEKTNKLKETAEIYTDLGLALMHAERYSESLDYLVKGLVIRQQLNNLKAVGNSYKNLGKVMEFLNEPKQALEYYLKAYDNLKETDDKKEISRVLINIGVVYCKLGEYKKSNNYYSEAMVILLQNDDQEGLMDIYMHLGNLTMKMGDLNAAIVYHNMSLKIANQLGNVNSICATYINLGDVYSNKLGSHEQGLEYLEKGLVLAKTVGNKKWESIAYRAIAETYFSMKQYQKAYLFEKKYAELNDSLVRSNTKMQIEKSKAVLQMQRDKLKESTRKIEESLSKNRTSDNRMLILAGTAGVLIIILLLLYLKERKKL